MDVSNPIQLSVTNSKAEVILPRSAWHSQLTKLRITLNTKQSLDRQELENDYLNYRGSSLDDI